MQHRGIGRALVEFRVAHVRAHAGNLLWWNGRTSVRPFYEAVGFRATGTEFDVPVSGAHFVFRMLLGD